jgi:hypothetical protein
MDRSGRGTARRAGGRRSVVSTLRQASGLLPRLSHATVRALEWLAYYVRASSGGQTRPKKDARPRLPQAGAWPLGPPRGYKRSAVAAPSRRSGSLRAGVKGNSGRGQAYERRAGLGVGRREAALWRGVEGLGGPMDRERKTTAARISQVVYTHSTALVGRATGTEGPGEVQSRSVLYTYHLLCACRMVC